MKFYKKLFKFFSLLILVTYIATISSFADEATPVVSAPSCILMDMNTGKILYNKNANEKMYPASTTKVMTAILTLENCNLTDTVTVTHDAVYNVPSSYSIADLHEGEQLTVDELLHVLLIPSANDAAFALADHIAGSVDKFADMMNEKANQLGCKNTHFVNPNGIHNDNHYTTAYDLALIGQYAMKNETFKAIVSTTKYTLPATNKYDKADRTFNTTNELINPNSKYYYQYATGAKTGYTEPAKCCIIATAKKGNTELIAVILHDEKTDTGIATREIDCKTLFEYGFNNYSLQILVSKDDVITNLKVKGATYNTKSLDLVADNDLLALNPNNYDNSSTSPNIILNDDIKAPISQGDILGTVSYTSDNFTYTTNLIASHDVYKIDTIKISLEIAIVIVILLIAIILTKSKKKKRKSHKKKKNSYLRYY